MVNTTMLLLLIYLYSEWQSIQSLEPDHFTDGYAVDYIFVICHHYTVVLTTLAVYTRNPAAYEALQSFKLLQLPCVRTLKYYINFNLGCRATISGEESTV